MSCHATFRDGRAVLRSDRHKPAHEMASFLMLAMSLAIAGSSRDDVALAGERCTCGFSGRDARASKATERSPLGAGLYMRRLMAPLFRCRGARVRFRCVVAALAYLWAMQELRAVELCRVADDAVLTSAQP